MPEEKVLLQGMQQAPQGSLPRAQMQEAHYRWAETPQQRYTTETATRVEDFHTATVMAKVLTTSHLEEVLLAVESIMEQLQVKIDLLGVAIQNQRPFVDQSIQESENLSSQIKVPLLREGFLHEVHHDQLQGVWKQVDLLNLMIASRNTTKVEFNRTIHTVTEIRAELNNRPQALNLTQVLPQ
jgi:hypothetical protein